MQKIKLTVLFLARALGMFALFRYLTRSQLRILCYHGGSIGDEHTYNSKLFCPPATLSARLRWLRKHRFNFMSLDDAVKSLANPRARPQLPTVVTFDDGWHSTGSQLVPLLAAQNIPSTLYLCTQHVAHEGPVPSVSVRYLLSKSALDEVSLGGFGCDVDGDYQLSDQSQRETLARAVAAWISKNTDGRQEVCAVLERFAACLQVPSATLDLASRRFDYLSPAELRVAAGQHCAIELHGHVHCYPFADFTGLQADIDTCRNWITAAGLPRARHYCYPSGDFDAQAAADLSRLDVISATTCVPGLIGTADPAQAYYLPRFLDGGSITALEFESEMSGFSDFVRGIAARSG